MSDRKLEYWYGWSINGPDGPIIDLNKPKSISEKESNDLDPIDQLFKGDAKGTLKDIDHICKLIKEDSDTALMSEDVWYRIVMLRRKAFKDKDAAEKLRKICKSIIIDERKRKSQEDLEDLIIMIKNDIRFFKEIQSVIAEDDKVNIDTAIVNFIRRGAKTDSQLEKRGKEIKNYSNVYYSYKRVYKELIAADLSDKEIFCFFERAAQELTFPNSLVTENPDGRFLEFEKKPKIWYIWGDDLHDRFPESEDKNT